MLSSSHVNVIHVFRQEQSLFSMNKQTFTNSVLLPIQVPIELLRTVCGSLVAEYTVLLRILVEVEGQQEMREIEGE